jgi:ribA/ribD-fused uncharacterized protein
MEDVLNFYSKSKDVYPGDGKHENVINKLDYDKLSKIKNWRKYLSNFHEEIFEYNNYHWNTIEHCFQAQKFANINHDIYYQFTINSRSELGSSGGEIARKNRKLLILNEEQLKLWDKNKLKIMKKISKKKYQKSIICKEILLLTRDAKLMHIMPRSNPMHFKHLEQIRNKLL